MKQADQNAPSQKSDVALAEEKVLQFWRERDIFNKTLQKPSPAGDYVFYDGPPFATGLPHYGHLLASTIKDAVPRYQTMRGKHVARRWGWDCHGLPIENIVEKDLKISGKNEIEKYGVENFNEYARSKVLDFVSHWKETIERIGRWVDFDGSYKTMDNTFMESVWWALKEVHKKGLLYEGVRVLPYCPRCETPIANSEIAMDNSYKDITDISVYVKLELEDELGTFLIAWTTTPWTLPGNTAAAVNKDLAYVKVKTDEGIFIVAKDVFTKISEKFKNPEIVEEFSGSKLVGKSYKPIFDYFASKKLPNKENAWKVYAAPYVTAEAGTGIVHLAPAYGEEDMELAKAHNIPFVYHVGSDGKFTADVTDFAGLKAKPKDDHQSSDILIIKNLAHRGVLFAKEKIVHSYPHCFRCETPLYYFAIPAWFIEIQKIKPRLLSLNEKIHWVPDHLKEGRFKKSMEGAPDWNISRNRYWASPLPIWKCADCADVQVFGSLVELQEKIPAKNTYFVMRHGQAQSNMVGIISSQPKDPHHLTDEGIEEVKKTAKKLVKEKIDYIITSDFIRTTETAHLVAEALGLSKDQVIFDERLRELNAGEFNGKKWDDFRAFFEGRKDRFYKAAPQGETLLELQARMSGVLFDLEKKYEGKRILIVSHDNPLYFLRTTAQGLSQDEIIRRFVAGRDSFHTGEFHKLEFSPFPHDKRGALDFHRPYIDDMMFPCKCGGVFKRIPEVIDCWFESGSMPFAARHYPFEHKKEFDNNFPAQFITEYIAQTRTWFYYTHVVSTMLFNKIAFEHVVTTGTILAEDGEKMSKSKGNFPDPKLLFDKYGADAVRFYMLSSPLMKSEDINFSEKGVDEVYKKIILRLKNVFSFYELYRDDSVGEVKSKNVLDVWIVARLNMMVQAVTVAMDAYEIDRALAPIDEFIEDLSVWYLRRSRDRFKSDDEHDKKAAISTFRTVLTALAKTLAPFTPFLAEEVYQKLGRGVERTAASGANGASAESVHLEHWPAVDAKSVGDVVIIEDMAEVRALVSRGLELRAKAGVKVRQPLEKLTVKKSRIEGRGDLLALIEDELNVKKIAFDTQLSEDVALDTHITPALKEEGQCRELIRHIQDLRKQEKLSAGDTARLHIYGSDAALELFRKFQKEISKTALLGEVLFAEQRGEKIHIDELEFALKVEKA